MSLDVMADLDDFIPDAPLDRGQYVIEVRDARETDRGSLMVNTTVVSGKPQANGKDPAGRDYTLFLTLHPEKIENDWARNRQMNLLKKFYLACGLDSSAEATDFIGKRIWVSHAPRVNKDTGEVREDPQDFRAFAG